MKRLINRSKQEAQELLSHYNDEMLDWMKQYKAEIENLVVCELQDGEWVEIPSDDEIDNARIQYYQAAADPNYVDSIGEFDTIYRALCILDGTKPIY